MKGYYIIQGILGEIVIFEESCNKKKEAKERAIKLSKDLTFEGDTVRVITLDGELVQALP
jgi:hypothetical protein